METGIWRGSSHSVRKVIIKAEKKDVGEWWQSRETLCVGTASPKAKMYRKH